MTRDKVPTRVEVTTKTILTVAAIIIAGFVLVKLQGVVFILFISFIITSSLRPLVDKFDSKKIPRIVTIFSIFVLVIATVLAFMFLILTSLAPQLGNLLEHLPLIVTNFLEKILVFVPWLSSVIDIGSLKEELAEMLKNGEISSDSVLASFKQALGLVNSAAEVAVGVVTTVILTVYMLSRKEKVLDQVLMFFSEKTRNKYLLLIPKIEGQLGSWLRAQSALIVLMGFLSWLGLTLIGIKFAIPVAIVIGLLELIPSVGPSFGWIIATIVAVGSGASFLQVLLVFSWSIFIQQLEHLLFVPKIFQKAVGLDPLVTILGIISASILFGFAGVIIAVPVLAVVQITLSHLKEDKKQSTR
ncbi:AI-2E family transporter [Candidatus Dojkabacteria bacterium]|nr:AI-2E family transporter [Candidatus Dojkabacteria bacterium]